MSQANSNLAQQKRAGYLLLGGALVTLVGGIAVFFYYDAPPMSYAGILVPVVILSAFGFRSITATRNEKALGDERTRGLIGRVSINAFWWLMAIILINGFWNVVPRESAEFLYLGSGLGIFAIYYVYYRYVR
ncbi:hypothetical protein ACT4ML_15800 [Natrinema sp. LN54]|uniref:hypothetical protein n=1 Tax=Natrinema sp. LN54 TaxID=3458705 RepID=UPI0040355722